LPPLSRHLLCRSLLCHHCRLRPPLYSQIAVPLAALPALPAYPAARFPAKHHFDFASPAAAAATSILPALPLSLCQPLPLCPPPPLRQPLLPCCQPPLPLPTTAATSFCQLPITAAASLYRYRLLPPLTTGYCRRCCHQLRATAAICYHRCRLSPASSYLIPLVLLLVLLPCLFALLSFAMLHRFVFFADDLDLSAIAAAFLLHCLLAALPPRRAAAFCCLRCRCRCRSPPMSSVLPASLSSRLHHLMLPPAAVRAVRCRLLSAADYVASILTAATVALCLRLLLPFAACFFLFPPASLAAGSATTASFFDSALPPLSLLLLTRRLYY
jgi:hypothetical protein